MIDSRPFELKYKAISRKFLSLYPIAFQLENLRWLDIYPSTLFNCAAI
jgi:hypothetical protein